MSFPIPNLKELATRTAGTFRANMKGSDAKLWPNNVAVTAKVIAAAVWEAFSYLEYIARQSIKHLAEGIWLERHAYDYGLARLPPTYATGQATLHGDIAIVVPAGLVLQRADGVQYTTTSGGTTDGDGDVTVAVRANAPGRAGNALADVVLSLTTPFDRIATEGEVAASGIGAGENEESDASLRARLLDRLRFPPHGGAQHDYVGWARQVNGVTRVFVDPVTANNGRNSVGVWFLMDNIYANGIPQAADVSVVDAYIDPLRPAGAIVAIAAPTPVTVNIVIDNLSTDTSAVRNAIAAELAEMFRRECRVSTVTEPFTLYRSQIDEAISIAVGETHHSLTTPAADHTYATGEIPVLGTITYT